MSCHISKGKKKNVAFVFSCPGRHEKDAGHPAAGTTGKNLCKLLDRLNTSLDRKDLSRKEITITNAWDKVKYKDCTGRTEATDGDIRSHGNIARLKDELKDINEFIVCSGNKSKTAIAAIDRCNFSKNVKILYIEHLGTRGINTITKDVNNDKIISAKTKKEGGCERSIKKIQAYNTSMRLDVVCKKLLEQIKVL